MKSTFILVSLLASTLGFVFHVPTNTNMKDTLPDERQEIIDTVTSLFNHTDLRDWEAVKETFADRVLLDYTSLAGGAPATLTPEEIVTGWAQVLPGFESTHHTISNFQVQVDNGEGTVHHYGTADHYLPNDSGGPLWVVVGTYDIHLKKTNGDWKIDQLTFNLKFMDGNTDLPGLAQERVLQSKNTTMNTYTPGKNTITFTSHGETLVGHLYLPADYQEGTSYPGVIVGGSWTTVKEQMAGLYAERLAQEGYAALAFDHRYYGESSGEPRFLEDPKAKTEDFIAAMDYLVGLPFIQEDKTGGMAICASGGYMADAVSQDPDFKAFAMVVPWFNTDEVVNAFYGGEAGINDRVTKSQEAMQTFKETGVMTYIPSISDTDPGAAMFGPFEYYLNEDIGRVANWSDDKFALASWEPWLTYRPVPIATKIEVPTLLITSEGAATPQAAQAFYDALQGPKQIEWIEGGQLDFYYQPAQVDASLKLVADHFSTHLK